MVQRLTFRGQVQRKEFDPLIIPDQVWKIDKETQDVVRGMEAVREAELRNRTEYLNSLKDTQDLEETIREENFDLATEHAEAYRDAELQHYKTRLADVSPGGAYALENRLKEENRQKKKQAWEQLKGLSSTVLGQVQAWDEEKGRKLLAYGTEVATRWGLTPEELKYFKFRGQNIDWADAGINRVRDRLKLAGASAEELNAILNLSGRAMLGAQEAAMGVAGIQAWPEFFHENKETPIEEAGGLTWAQIEQDPDGIYSSEARIIMRNLEGEFLLKFKGIGQPGNGYDDQFLAAHLRPQMDKFSKKELALISNRDYKAYEKRENKSFDDKILGKMFSYGSQPDIVAQGIYDTMHSESGMNPKQLGRARRRTYSALKRFAKDGRFTLQMWRALDNLEYQKGGKGPKLRWGDPKSGYYREQQELLTIINARFADDWRHRKNEELSFGKQWVDRLIDIGVKTGDAATDYEVKNAMNEFTARGYEVPQEISAFLTREKIADKFAEQDLRARVNSTGLRMSELYSGHYSKAMIAKFAPLTIEKQGVSDDVIRLNKQAVRNAVQDLQEGKLTRTEQRSSESLIVEGLAVAKYQERLNDLIVSGQWDFKKDGDINQLYRKVSTDIVNEIKSGELFPLKIDPNTGQPYRTGDNAGFQILDKMWTYDKVAHESRKQAKENPSIIDTDPDFISDELMKAVVDMKPGDHYPHALQLIKQAYPTQTYLQVINRARAIKELDPLPPRGAQGIPLCIRPELRKYMTHKPSLAKTKACVIEEAKALGDEFGSISYMPYIQTKKDLVAHIPDPSERVNAVRNSSGGIETTDEKYNNKITDLPVAEWENIIQRGGEKITHGEFGAEDLQDFEDRGWIQDPLAAVLDEATVNNLINKKIDWETSHLYANIGGSNTAIPGTGHYEHEDPTFVPDETYQQKGLALALIGINVKDLIDGVLS